MLFQPPATDQPQSPRALEHKTEDSDRCAAAVSSPVVVEVRDMPSRGGRPRLSEKYPFGTIAIAVEIDGRLRGDSFFIPDEDDPANQLAAARKRHKPKRFSERKEGDGVRIWRVA